MILKKLFTFKGNSNSNNNNGNTSSGSSNSPPIGTRPRGATFHGTLPTLNGQFTPASTTTTTTASPTNLTSSTNNTNNLSVSQTTNNSNNNNNIPSFLTISTPTTNSGTNSLRSSKDGSGGSSKKKNSNSNNNRVSSTLNNRQTLLLKSMEYVVGSSSYYGSYMEFYDLPPQIFVGGELSPLYHDKESMFSTNPHLKSLILDFNKISDLPECITLLINLKHLSLAANQLKEIPEHLHKLTCLETLELGINQFTQFPVNICKIKSLTSLHIETNNIQSLPSEFSNLSNLKTLSLSDNAFKEIPDSLPRNLVKLNLGCNDIVNTFSNSLIGIAHSLTSLNLTENNIKVLDDSLCCLVNVQCLQLDSNMIKEIPGEMIRCWKSLETLNLPHNYITDLPAEIITLSNLRIIDLRGNGFEFCKKMPSNESSSVLFKIDQFIKDKEKLQILKQQLSLPPSLSSSIQSISVSVSSTNNNNSTIVPTTTTSTSIDDAQNELNLYDSKDDGNENIAKIKQLQTELDLVDKQILELELQKQEKQKQQQQLKLQYQEEQQEKLNNKLQQIKHDEIESNATTTTTTTTTATSLPALSTLVVQQPQQLQQQPQQLQQPQQTQTQAPQLPTLTVKKPDDQVEVEMVVPNQLIFWQSICPDQIIENLYLGCRECAMNKSWLKDHNITHILSVGNFKPLNPHLFKYLIINIDDVDEANIYQYFKEMNTFIEEGREKGGILIHCRAGVSRSATATMAYIMMKRNLKFQDAFDITIKGRPRIYPNIGFINQLKKYEKDLSK